jgi:hypothetical protein
MTAVLLDYLGLLSLTAGFFLSQIIALGEGGGGPSACGNFQRLGKPPPDCHRISVPPHQFHRHHHPLSPRTSGAGYPSCACCAPIAHQPGSGGAQLGSDSESQSPQTEALSLRRHRFKKPANQAQVRTQQQCPVFLERLSTSTSQGSRPPCQQVLTSQGIICFPSKTSVRKIL